MTIAATHLDTGYDTDTDAATGSVSPTSGARLYAFVTSHHDDEEACTAEWTVSGLSGTWTLVPRTNTILNASSGNGLMVGLYVCDDWSGSGAITATYAGADSTGIDETTIDVCEVTGLSDDVAHIGVTMSLDGWSDVTSNEAPQQFTIGSETAEAVPTNGATLAWWAHGDTGFTTLNNTARYDNANWSVLGAIDEQAGNNRMFASFYSSGGDTTLTPVGAACYGPSVCVGLILVNDGDEPTSWAVPAETLDTNAEDDGESIASLTGWSAYQITGSGVLTTDNHSGHGPTTRMIDASTTGEQRAVSSTQCGSDDHGVPLVWFFDTNSGGSADHTATIYLRLQDGTAGADDDGYAIRFVKEASAADEITSITIYEMTNSSLTSLASYTTNITTGSSLSGVNLYATIVGDDITVYVNGTEYLTHDIDGDATEYNTGEYWGFGHYREFSAGDSQPFVYRPQAVTFASVSAGDATATPTVVTADGEVPAPTVTAEQSATATPAVVTGDGEVPSPTVTSDATASPTVVTGDGEVPAPSDVGAPATYCDTWDGGDSSTQGSDTWDGGDSSTQGSDTWDGGDSTTTACIEPTVVDADGEVPAPTVSAGSTASPATVDGEGEVPAPTVTAGAGATAAPTVVTADGSVESPTVSAGTSATVTPTTVTGDGELPAPSVTAGSSATATPTVVTADGSVEAPTVTAEQSATATPAVVTADGEVPSPAITSDATASPTVVTADGSVESPTVTSSATATPTVVTGDGEVLAPGVTAGGSATASPDPVDGEGEVLAPTVSAGSTASPSTVEATGEVPTPTVTAGQSAAVTPTVVEATGEIPSPTPGAGVGVTPSVVEADGEVLAPGVSAGGSATATPDTVTGDGEVPAPAITSDATVAPSVVEAVGEIPSPTVSTGTDATVTPSTVEATGEVLAATISTTSSATATPSTVEGVGSVLAPTVSTGAATTVVKAPPRRISRADPERTIKSVAGEERTISPP